MFILKGSLFFFSTDRIAVILRYLAEVYMLYQDIDIIVLWVDILSGIDFIGLLIASISHVM